MAPERSFAGARESALDELSCAHLVILAGGAGKRLRNLTRRLAEGSLPKQFCRFGGTRSLLQRTIERTGEWIPPERVTVVVTGEQASVAESQLRRYPGARLLVQPLSRGTAPAALLGALSVQARDPRALVVLAPCDHAFGDESVLVGALARACRNAREHRAVVLLGARACAPSTDYGWIVAGAPTNGPPRVLAFVEKPPPERAQELLAAGALWSTLILAAPGAELLSMYATAAPGLFAAVRPLLSREPTLCPRTLARAYGESEDLDLSRDVLSRARNLRVRALSSRARWTDLGNEERLLRWLEQSPSHRAAP